ncbi:hypothetical protein ACHAWF_011142, partial [Thalassiosira exigua]
MVSSQPAIAAAAGLLTTLCRCSSAFPLVDRGIDFPRRLRAPSSPFRAIDAPASTTATSLRAFRWPTLPSFPSPTESSATDAVGERNGLDPDYPWRFEGRFVFRPSLVRAPSEGEGPPSATILSLFGWSLGGSVVLEYDVSPVGPYREYVTMGGVVGLGRVDAGGGEEGGTLAVGQWGTDLYVSTQVAEDVCRRVWGVPAQVADIEFEEEADTLVDGPDGERGSRRAFRLSGWGNARVFGGDEASKRFGNVPIYWTPTIKALWAPFVFPGGTSTPGDNLLPLHKL